MTTFVAWYCGVALGVFLGAILSSLPHAKTLTPKEHFLVFVGCFLWPIALIGILIYGLKGFVELGDK